MLYIQGDVVTVEEIKRVALYSRFSTHTQDGNFSIDIQNERMEAMCKSKGWEIGDYFTDAAYSGSNMKRPELQNLLSRLKEFDVVMVYRLDRLSRSQRDTMTLIQDYFLKNHVAFVSVSETLDTTTPFGMAMIGILAVFAELERATITERMQGGIEKRIQNGYRLLSGNHMPTGYKKGEGTIMEIDDIEAQKVHRIYDLYEQYHSITKIQETLKQEGYAGRRFTTIRQILSNPLYIGKVKYRDKYFDGKHPAIISKDQFNRVQILLSRHPKGNNAGKAKESLFSGMITCGKCGESYKTYSYKVVNKKKGDHYVRSYLCRARRFPSEYDEKCFNSIVKNEVIENLFIQELINLIHAELSESKNTSISSNYELALKRIDNKINRLIDLYEDGEIDKNILNYRMEQRNKEKEELLLKQSSEAQNKLVREDLDEIDKIIIDFGKLDFIEKRALIEKVLKGIVIDGDDIIFEWNI